MARMTPEQVDEKYGAGAYYLLRCTDSFPGRGGYGRLERIAAFCRKYGVTPEQCEVWRQPRCGEWLDRRSCRETEPPVAYIGGTHSYAPGEWRDYVIAIQPDVWEQIVAVDPSRANWYADRHIAQPPTQ